MLHYLSDLKFKILQKSSIVKSALKAFNLFLHQ